MTASVEPGDSVGGVDEIPWLLGETWPANPVNSVLQGPTELLGVFYGLDMIFGFFALHLHGRRWQYYLAGEQILSYWGKEGDRLNRVNLDISRELQFVCMGADSVFNKKRADLLSIQLLGRPSCLDEIGIYPDPITAFELWGWASSLVICFGMLVLGCSHLGLDQGVDLLQVGGCLMCARLRRVLY